MILSVYDEKIAYAEQCQAVEVTVPVEDLKRMLERLREEPDDDDFYRIEPPLSRCMAESLIGKRLFRWGVGGGFRVQAVVDCTNPFDDQPSFKVLVKEGRYTYLKEYNPSNFTGFGVER